MKDEYDFSKGKRGAILSTEGMTHIHIHIKDETLEELRKQAEQLGTGYQTLINGILRKHLESGDDIAGLPLESRSLNREHPMWQLHQQHVSHSGNSSGKVLSDEAEAQGKIRH